ncbi:MAG: DUF116 domain-containing protein [Pseudomonadota bacterium]
MAGSPQAARAAGPFPLAGGDFSRPSPLRDMARFLGLSALGLALFPALALAAGAMRVLFVGSGVSLFPSGGLGGLALSVSGLALLCLALVAGAIWGRRSRLLFKAGSLALSGLYPLHFLAARLAGADKRSVERSFIRVNNRMVEHQAKSAEASRVLLLLPHCLQFHECGVRITMDPSQCKRCGKCPMTGLLGLSEERGTPLAVATGGTLARRFVAMHRPRLVVAVACERDLWSGIRDSSMPVYGVLNQRPHGPCFDTGVDLAALALALDRFCIPEAPGLGEVREAS